MKVATAIRKRVIDQGTDSLWSYTDFGDLPFPAVAKSLSRLAKEGLVQRVRKGLYYYPKQTALGPSQPSTSALLSKAVGQSAGSPIFSGGTASFQNLGLTTQMPAEYTLLGSSGSRTFRIGKITARICHGELDHLLGASQQDVWCLDAIRNLKHVPDSTPADALVKIMGKFRSGTLPVKRLLRFAEGEPPRVRALIGAMAEQVGYRGPEIKRLRKSLNPLTKFRIGVSSVLSNASTWNIV